MAHLVENMAYIGATPWHGLGEKLEAGQSIDQWRIAAGLDWRINATPVQYESNGEVFKFDDKVALFRSDNNMPLSVVSNRYNVVQPSEVMEFYRDLTESGNMTLDTAGSLKDGKKIWALATNENAITLGGVDVIKPYLLLVTACDGTMATRAYFTTVRVVCNNTLQMSLKDRVNGVSVPHSTKFDAVKVKSQLGLMDEGVDTFASNADNLASKGMSDKEAVNYFAELYVKRTPDGEVGNEKSLEKTVNKLMELYKNGPGAEFSTANGTKWGALNAVTRFVDFEQGARNNENRFESGQFGQGAKTKAQAVELLAA